VPCALTTTSNRPNGPANVVSDNGMSGAPSRSSRSASNVNVNNSGVDGFSGMRKSYVPT
jgi:hypothetical protein